MSTPAASFDWLSRLSADGPAIDRKILAGLLVELACNVEPGLGARTGGIRSVDPRLEQLRELLVGREIETLQRLCELIEDPERFARAVGRVLPVALAQVSNADELGRVLAPTLEKATQSSIRRDPRTLVNILYPLIVPAIGKSIGEAIDQTFQSLNESLKHSLSWRGLQWRLEAWRTGTSFTEVVLKHTLVYQVEHVFLIHQHTGLLIAHAVAADSTEQDPQLVSSMLAAIQDFVRDSFAGADQQGVDALRLGDFRLWSVQGPSAMLVAVIRGNPPEKLREQLRSVLSAVHAEHGAQLASFRGDGADFGDLQAALSTCLVSQKIEQRPARGIPWRVAVLGAALFLAICTWGFWSWQERRLWEGYVTRLRSEPGIVVTEVDRRGGKFVVGGLRDPLALDPEQLLRSSHIAAPHVLERWQPYQALDPAIVIRRLQLAATPPRGVTLTAQGDRIIVHGAAPAAWLERARAAGRMLPAGSPTLDLSAVVDTDGSMIVRLRAAIQAAEIHFDVDQSLPAAGQEMLLDQLADDLKQLVALSPDTHITLTGNSDATGQETFNLTLSLARAEAVRALLKRRGVDPTLLAVRAAGRLEPQEAGTSSEASSINRHVSFSVSTEE